MTDATSEGADPVRQPGARVLVTGGSGYFGSILVRHLAARGTRVRVLDLHDAADRPPKVEFVAGDIRDARAVQAALREVSVVYHNVAQVPLARDARQFWSVNVGGTHCLLEACLEARVQKVVNTSSSAVFGVPDRNPVTEASPLRPLEAYGEAKAEQESVCRSFIERGLDISIVRPRTVVGPGRLGIFQILYEWVAQGHAIPVLGTGDNRYQLVHGEDLAEACLRAGARIGPDVFNVGAAEYGTMRETLEALVDFAQTGSRVVAVPLRPAVWGMEVVSRLGLAPLGPYHWLMYGREFYFDLEHTCRTLDWKPRFSNAALLIDAYRWYLEQRDAVLSQTSGSPHRRAVSQGILAAMSVGLTRITRWGRPVPDPSQGQKKGLR